MSDRIYEVDVEWCASTNLGRYSVTVEQAARNEAKFRAIREQAEAEAEKPKYGDVGFTHANRIVFYGRAGWKDEDGDTHMEITSPVRVWFNIYDVLAQGPIVIGMTEDGARSLHNTLVRRTMHVDVAVYLNEALECYRENKK